MSRWGAGLLAARMDSMENLIKALVKAQKEFAPLTKSATNPHFKNKFVPLHEVLASVLPILNKNGLAIAQFPSEGPSLTTHLMHESGEIMSDVMPLFLPKQDPQGQGSAITYARRYALMSILGIVGDEDDDGQKGSADKVTLKSGNGPTPMVTNNKDYAPPFPVDKAASPLDEAKARLRAAIKAGDVDASQFGWVKDEKSVKKITEAAVALENVTKALNG